MRAAERFMTQASSSKYVQQLGIQAEQIQQAAQRFTQRFAEAVSVAHFDSTRLFVRPVSTEAKGKGSGKSSKQRKGRGKLVEAKGARPKGGAPRAGPQ